MTTEKNENIESQDQPILSDDIDIEVVVAEEENAIYVKFTGFEDEEETEEYALTLAEVLPLLLFESTRIH
jgi:hypothetical protein